MGAIFRYWFGDGINFVCQWNNANREYSDFFDSITSNAEQRANGKWQTAKCIVMPKWMDTDKNVMKRKWLSLCYSTEISRILHIFFSIVLHITSSSYIVHGTCMVAKELLIIDYVRFWNEKRIIERKKREQNKKERKSKIKCQKMKEIRTLNLTNMCALMGTFFQSNHSLKTKPCYLLHGRWVNRKMLPSIVVYSFNERERCSNI